jgi:hypothetical protein
LHGNVNRGEQAPDGTDDQNVFDIKDAGVAIYLGIKGTRDLAADNRVSKTDLWGDRETRKYPFLWSNTYSTHHWDTVTSEPEFFLFRTLSQHGSGEYKAWPKVTDVFPLHSIGMITARDSYVMDFTSDPVVQRAKAFRDSKLDDEATCRALGIPIKKGWNITRARERIKSVKDLNAHVQPVLYRPFDVRQVFYHESLIWGMAWPVMQHMVGGKNLALITSRMTKGESFQHVLVSNTLSEVILLSSKTSNNAFAFPLYLQSDDRHLQLGTRTNLAPHFLALLANVLGLRREKATGLPTGLSPEEIFHFAYAVFHSPAYRNRYAEFLKIDFPRLPLTGDLALFRRLARLGSDLVAMHLLESPTVSTSMTEFSGRRNCEVEKISWSRNTVWIDKAQTTGFKGVREAVWKFHIGGYQVCEKWLKDRKGRMLSKDDIAHYGKIVVALGETIRLMKEIDEVIERHGGWPAAFAEGIPSSDALGTSDADAGAGASPEGDQQALLVDDGGPESDNPEPERARSISFDDLDAEGLICAVRQLFNDGTVRNRDSAIGDLAGQVGFARMGSRIRESLDNAVRTAMRRGILENNGSGLRIHARSLEEYDRSFLKEQFLASLRGKAWTDRDDAVQGFARWMGFRRTGSTIADTARSLINGLIREERLESDGSRIRRCG